MDSHATDSSQPVLDERDFPLASVRTPLGTPLMAGVIVTFLILNVLEAARPDWSLPIISAIGAAMGLVTAFIRSSLLIRQLPDRVRLTETNFGYARGARLVQSVDLRRLSEVNELETPLGKMLLVSDDRTSVELLAQQLRDPRHYHELTRSIVDIVEQIDPSGHVARVALKTGRLRETLIQQPIRGSFALAGFLGLATFLAFHSRIGLEGTPFPNEELGAFSSTLFLAKPPELFRLFSYVFLHGTVQQALLTVLGILWVGGHLERILGWERVLIAFVVGAIGGALGHLQADWPLPMVGASPGLFGLLGLLAAVTLLGRGRLPRVFLPGIMFWFLTLILAALLPLSTPPVAGIPFMPPFPIVTLWSHLGGFVLGLVVGIPLVMGLEFPATMEQRRDMRALAWMGVASLVIGLVGGMTHSRRGHDFDGELLTEAILDMPGDLGWQVQNMLAYGAALDKKSNILTLSIAQRLANRARVTSHDDPSVLDTLACVRYVQGEVEEAEALLMQAGRLAEDGPVKDAILKNLETVRSGGVLKHQIIPAVLPKAEEP